MSKNVVWHTRRKLRDVQVSSMGFTLVTDDGIFFLGAWMCGEKGKDSHRAAMAMEAKLKYYVGKVVELKTSRYAAQFPKPGKYYRDTVCSDVRESFGYEYKADHYQVINHGMFSENKTSMFIKDDMPVRTLGTNMYETVHYNEEIPF